MKTQTNQATRRDEVLRRESDNVFNNYLNHIAETEVDFPAYPELEKVQKLVKLNIL